MTELEDGPSEYGQFPLKHHLGMDVSGDDAGTAHLTIGAEHLNPNGVVHGAVLFALVDTAMGEATMNALRAGPLLRQHRSLVAIHPTRRGGRSDRRRHRREDGSQRGPSDARVVGDDERLVATAAGTFAIIDP